MALPVSSSRSCAFCLHTVRPRARRSRGRAEVPTSMRAQQAQRTGIAHPVAALLRSHNQWAARPRGASGCTPDPSSPPPPPHNHQRERPPPARQRRHHHRQRHIRARRTAPLQSSCPYVSCKRNSQHLSRRRARASTCSMAQRGPTRPRVVFSYSSRLVSLLRRLQRGRLR